MAWKAQGYTRDDIRDGFVAHAHLVDLFASPRLKDAARAGRINSHQCPRCSHVGFTPRYVWIQELPGSMDELTAAATVWRLDAKTIIDQAPAGTIEDNNNDVVFETRCDELLRQIGDDAFEPQETQTSVSLVLVYDHRQLVDFIGGRDKPDALPADMFALGGITYRDRLAFFLPSPRIYQRIQNG